MRANPPALGLQPLPGSYGRQRSKDRYLIAVPSDFYPKHTEAVFVVVESDALDQARDFLGDRLVRTCGIHLVGDSFSHGWWVLAARSPAFWLNRTWRIRMLQAPTRGHRLGNRIRRRSRSS